MEEKIIPPDQGEQLEAASPEFGSTIVRRPPQKKRHIFGWILFLLFAAAAALGLFCYLDEVTLCVIPRGEPELLLEYGSDYSEQGAQVVLKGKQILKNGIVLDQIPVSMESDLQEDVLGKYTVTYTASWLRWSIDAQRTIRVVDRVAPVLKLIDTDYTVLPGSVYEEEGYIAVDNYDGNLTERVQKSRKRDVITYTVMDSSGNPASAQRKIPYFDPEAPELLLEGSEHIIHPCGTFFEEPGYSAEDNVDGDLTEAVALEGEVIWYQPGTYELVYTIADAFGNVTQKVRTVEVVAAERPEIRHPNGRVIYLTFDDGPGPYTGRLLDVLKRYGVKATFFVAGSSDKDGYLWRMYREGHSIGLHTTTHDYNSIYASPEAFFEDLYGVRELVYRNTGIRSTLMRFPGGSSNLVSNYNEGIMTLLTQAVQDAGFQYFDWNVDSDDAGSARTSKKVAENVIEGVQKQRVSIVLQHDTNSFSVDAVEDIIVWGLEHGYQFLPLTANSPTMQHDVMN